MLEVGRLLALVGTLAAMALAPAAVLGAEADVGATGAPFRAARRTWCWARVRISSPTAARRARSSACSAGQRSVCTRERSWWTRSGASSTPSGARWPK
jgi:hypothetical protein